MLAPQPFAPSRLVRLVIYAVVLVGTFLLDGVLVALLWANGVDFATLDRVPPGGSGFQINPLPDSYKLLLLGILAANVSILLYLLAKRRLWYAASFVAGATVPMNYLIRVLFS